MIGGCGYVDEMYIIMIIYEMTYRTSTVRTMNVYVASQYYEYDMCYHTVVQYTCIWIEGEGGQEVVVLIEICRRRLGDYTYMIYDNPTAL